jgi:transcriptional regulator with XRE-family HTH domain
MGGLLHLQDVSYLPDNFRNSAYGVAEHFFKFVLTILSWRVLHMNYEQSETIVSEDEATGMRMAEARERNNGKDNKFTQQQMANKVGCRRVTLNAYECGRTTLPLYVVREYHREFNVTYDWLIDGKDISTSECVELFESLTRSGQRIALENMKTLKREGL